MVVDLVGQRAFFCIVRLYDSWFLGSNATMVSVVLNIPLTPSLLQDIVLFSMPPFWITILAEIERDSMEMGPSAHANH